MQMINIFLARPAVADLNILCGSSSVGFVQFGKNLSKFAGHEFEIINQSVTGIFEQKTNLLKC